MAQRKSVDFKTKYILYIKIQKIKSFSHDVKYNKFTFDQIPLVAQIIL